MPQLPKAAGMGRCKEPCISPPPLRCPQEQLARTASLALHPCTVLGITGKEHLFVVSKSDDAPCLILETLSCCQKLLVVLLLLKV